MATSICVRTHAHVCLCVCVRACVCVNDTAREQAELRACQCINHLPAPEEASECGWRFPPGPPRRACAWIPLLSTQHTYPGPRRTPPASWQLSSHRCNANDTRMSFPFKFPQLTCWKRRQCKARQLYLYSTFHTQGRLKVLHI